MRGPKRFTRVTEDFVCEHCSFATKGNGYTNHCPHCLWSKHVDINPGDRSAHCGGMMPVVWIEHEKGKTVLTHKCEVCGHTKRNVVAENDSIDALVETQQRIIAEAKQ